MLQRLNVHVTVNANATAAAKLDLDDSSLHAAQAGGDAGCGTSLEIGAATGVISTGTRAGTESPPSRPLARL
ncbi:hypothetical protein A5906_05025 [Bradyrhizobium sacchari]|uniref:hypothetical protein n=1 Tax=Bradyrhizobium sacchari TaxID=1399419 RepID=UPI0009B00317|nr:hypothetical protein [Bradyrhizobium sacchari]OPY96050.1 hypothetical protein A5906_05025 [Bradyrhizobium sacchari]